MGGVEDGETVERREIGIVERGSRSNLLVEALSKWSKIGDDGGCFSIGLPFIFSLADANVTCDSRCFYTDIRVSKHRVFIRQWPLPGGIYSDSGGEKSIRQPWVPLTSHKSIFYRYVSRAKSDQRARKKITHHKSHHYTITPSP